ncbi:MAG TPA: helix-turn-helix transcriptional regulator [Terracidiphilus sp.]|jgi:transcriptional regulator with XRE-family HTH domain|nr:helix-turn-helix transcriptional regulator [Terracidiphilus sp.]
MGKPPKSETRRSRKARTAPFQATYDEILQKLILAREEAGLNQREVSEQMGFSHSFLSKCETGERRIDIMELLELAKLYRKPPQYFLSSD